jgi:hypothetical protein
MKTKITLITLLLLFTTSLTTMAQKGEAKKSDGFNWQKKYLDEAGIPDSTQTKIKVVIEEASTKIKAIKKDATLTEEDKKTKTKEVYKKRYEDIHALLTKLQKQKIKEIKERVEKE